MSRPGRCGPCGEVGRFFRCNCPTGNDRASDAIFGAPPICLAWPPRVSWLASEALCGRHFDIIAIGNLVDVVRLDDNAALRCGDGARCAASLERKGLQRGCGRTGRSPSVAGSAFLRSSVRSGVGYAADILLRSRDPRTDPRSSTASAVQGVARSAEHLAKARSAHLAFGASVAASYRRAERRE